MTVAAYITRDRYIAFLRAVLAVVDQPFDAKRMI
jgi:hypothetical protein